MTAPTRTAYPVPVSDLIPKARKLAADLGTVPSRNRLMAEYKIGRDKARAILAELTAPAESPAVPVPADLAGPHLHIVTSTGDSNGTAPNDDPASAETPPAPIAQEADAVAPGKAPVATTAANVKAAAGGISRWPILLLALPAFVAVWSGWVGLGQLTGFGVVHPLPGIADGFAINSAITLPIGVETYAAYAMRAWLSGTLPSAARRFAKWSAIGSLILGALGQVAYHLLSANGVTSAPWQITTVVACLPVAVLGMGAALAHLIHQHRNA